MRDRLIVAFLISCAFLLSLLYPLILKLVIYFFPLLSTTIICFTTFYLFVMSERQATKEILLVHGEKSNRVVVQVYDDEVNRSIYSDQIEECCFLLRPEHEHLENWSEEDSERVIFIGKLHVGIDDLGKSSKWHCTGNLAKEKETREM